MLQWCPDQNYTLDYNVGQLMPSYPLSKFSLSNNIIVYTFTNNTPVVMGPATETSTIAPGSLECDSYLNNYHGHSGSVMVKLINMGSPSLTLGLSNSTGSDVATENSLST